MKMDIEGHEITLLKAPIIKPCIVEVHTSELERKFKEKGFKTVYCKKGYFLMSSI
jgi:hypothetical protein